jgi:hypothetical protein
MRAYGCLFAISWGLNFAWEMAHSFLYRNVPPFPVHLPFLFLAAISDAAVSVALIGIVALVLGNRFWFLEPAFKGLTILVSISSIASVLIEYLNTGILGRWTYTAAMPRLPVLHIGLTPFLQVAVLPTISAVLTALRCRRPSFFD